MKFITLIPLIVPQTFANLQFHQFYQSLKNSAEIPEIVQLNALQSKIDVLGRNPAEFSHPSGQSGARDRMETKQKRRQWRLKFFRKFHKNRQRSYEAY